MTQSLEQALAHWLAEWRREPAACAASLCTQGRALAALDAAADAASAPSDWLAARVGAALQARGWRVAVAESCTGGGIGAALTAIPGSSSWVEGGCITYSNAAKTGLLGVSAALIEAHGAVSGPVVEAMAAGARARLACECAVAVSGVAGPGGGSPHKPVGTVWLAWDSPAGRHSLALWLPGGRAAVREGAVWAALLVLLAAATD